MCWVDTYIDIKQIIYTEEESFFKLLNKFKNIKISSPEEAFNMRTSLGCPEELIQDTLSEDDFEEYKKILDESKQLNRSKTIKKVY